MDKQQQEEEQKKKEPNTLAEGFEPTEEQKKLWEQKVAETAKVVNENPEAVVQLVIDLSEILDTFEQVKTIVKDDEEKKKEGSHKLTKHEKYQAMRDSLIKLTESDSFKNAFVRLDVDCQLYQRLLREKQARMIQTGKIRVDEETKKVIYYEPEEGEITVPFDLEKEKNE